MEKTSCKAKIPPGKFIVTTPKNPSSYKYKESYQYQTYPKIPTYNWTFAPISN